MVREEKWQGTLTAIGSITAVQGVTVTPEIPGTVREIAFESGAVVAKGDLLVRLDTSSEEAQLRALEAQVELARLNLDRVRRRCAAENMVSQAELDTAEATLKQTQANADAIRATIEKKTIRAPFAGRLGIRLVNLGQYLDTGKPIVSLQSLTPVYADFSLPQQELARLKTGMRVRVTTDAYPGQQFEGTLTAINPDLDQSTRSVRLAGHVREPGATAAARHVRPRRGAAAGGADVLVIPATVRPERALRRLGLCHRIRSRHEQRPAPSLVVRQQFIRTGPRARRFRQRGIGPQARRTHRQLRHLQAAQRHGRGREQRPGAQADRDAAPVGQLIPGPRP